MIILTFFAFLSGIVTILSPCILPVLPIVLSGSIGGKRKPLGVVIGFILSFSLFTLILSTIVQVLEIPPDSLRAAAIVIITGFGLVLLVPALQQKFELLASKVVSRKQSGRKSGFKGGILVGASLGLLWTPCVGPIMASVIGLAVSRQVDGGAVIIILAYAAGTAIPMFGVMLGGRKILSRFPKLTAGTGKIQRLFGILMIAVGLSIGFGIDRRFQTLILTAFPNYGSGLTAFENSDFIQRALDRRADSDDVQSSEIKPMNRENAPHNAELDDFGPAPELVNDNLWLNTEQPLSMEELFGKVVLIDFWTYSCVNCVRTIPYLRSWHDKYADEGLVIIGVHSPEFAFEREPDNVRKAAEDLGVIWPVILDNSFEQWRAYGNRYWPAHYFIDAEGRIRYFHFGEGEYENSEKVIRKLLSEAGANPTAKTTVERWRGPETQTPEIYLGWERAEGFLSEDIHKNDQRFYYSIPHSPANGEWALEGDWIIRDEYIEAGKEAALELGFYSSNVFLVIEPFSGGGSLEVIIDGESVQVLQPVESKLYKIAAFDESSEHLLKLKVNGNLRFYAFTFG